MNLEKIEKKLDRILELLEKPKNPNRVKNMKELNKKLPRSHYSEAVKKRWREHAKKSTA